MITFTQFLEQRCIDCQELTPELHASLMAQYEAEQQRLAPVDVLVVPSDCQWPARGYWTPVVGQ